MTAPALPATRLHLCGRFNSTLFTDCCNVATTERDRSCPSCRRLIAGREPSRTEPCRECRGSGWVACGPVRSATCTNCHGSGRVQ